MERRRERPEKKPKPAPAIARRKPSVETRRAKTGEVARASSARRVPLQARSRERVERILDAAEHEFAEHGYEAATTEAIAARAGAAIGSLYQFFPNKRALFDALAERYLGRVEVFFTGLLTEGAATLSWPDLVDATIDAFWAFTRREKAFRAVWIHGHFSPELLHASDELNRAMSSRADVVLAAYAPHLSPEKREAIATILIEVTGVVLFIASRKREPLGSAIIEETKRLMRAYVSTYAEPETPAAKKPARGAKGNSSSH